MKGVGRSGSGGTGQIWKGSSTYPLFPRPLLPSPPQPLWLFVTQPWKGSSYYPLVPSLPAASVPPSAAVSLAVRHAPRRVISLMSAAMASRASEVSSTTSNSSAEQVCIICVSLRVAVWGARNARYISVLHHFQ